MNRTEVFQSQRARLFAIAYRMLGSAAEAEDVLQDAWLRWEAADGIDSPPAWLSTVVTRLSLDRLKSAQRTRETYVGPWLPEPVRTDAEPVDPESISMAFLVMLERLTPVERAAYLLHEVFDYSHAEVAAMLEREEATCRQIYHRAKSHLQQGRARFAPSRAEHERLLRAFADALARGDVGALEATLATDATLYADSGGKVPAAARKPLQGGHAIAQFFAGLVRKFPPAADQRYEVVEVNGWPALVGRRADGTNFALSIETDGDKIFAIRNVVNPDKLARV
jgi:RNA polymerase sigma-70 factor (ECF subfamily)